ncbi:hypothetical protein LZZ85_15375 [Terrimonas sp. NA20]|uniref:Uncharacterized protein n=1 Tax=Terrimonas ginsenosidimutans TaxID=2908004 RepID=A0ABS9KTM4_9BACT|nr:hypothetical protein [Terrimonas ginsenosidimutans]MCG2615681.1 hypothetical protein [Terrimonas ginsenosidimutans]
MIRFLLTLFVLTMATSLKAQTVDSIYFHLYTDSLKKGTHNYINVDGKLSNGQWQPLSAKEISFSSSDYSFSGNELILPMECSVEKVTVKAVLKSNPAIWKETTIWIKRAPDPMLPSRDEILRNTNQKRRKN